MSWLELSSSFKPGLPRSRGKPSRRRRRPAPGGRSRRRPAGAIVFVGLLAAAVAGVRWLLVASPYFEVRKIEVSHLQTYSEEQIIELAGISPGKNIFLVDPALYRERIVAEVNIEDASVYRIFPDTLRISLRERQPRARFRYGRYYTIDGWGVVLEGEKERGAGSLPVISGPGLSVRDGRLQPAEEVSECLALLRKLDDSNLSLALDLTEIRLPRSRVVELRTASGHEITMSRENISEQLSHLRTLLPHLDGMTARRAVVDLRHYPNIPVKYR